MPFTEKQSWMQNLTTRALKFEVAQECGKIIYYVMISCSQEDSEEPISSKFNVPFPKQLFLKEEKMHCNFMYIGFVLLHQIKKEQISERQNGSKGDQNV